MYHPHFSLREPPFSLTPDTAYFFAHPSAQAALNTLLVALRFRRGLREDRGRGGVREDAPLPAPPRRAREGLRDRLHPESVARFAHDAPRGVRGAGDPRGSRRDRAPGGEGARARAP